MNSIFRCFATPEKYPEIERHEYYPSRRYACHKHGVINVGKTFKVRPGSMGRFTIHDYTKNILRRNRPGGLRSAKKSVPITILCCLANFMSIFLAWDNNDSFS